MPCPACYPRMRRAGASSALLVCMEEAKCVVAAEMSSGIGKANLLFRLRDLRLYLERSGDGQLARGWGVSLRDESAGRG